MADASTSPATQNILKRLIKLPKSWTQNPARELIQQGIIIMEEDRKMKPRVCLLFNDIFLITKPQCEFIDNDTKLQNEKAQLKFKNFLFLRSCYIDESPKTIKSVSHLLKQHSTYPFVLIGENPLNHKNLQIAMSCKDIHDRQNWLKNTHRAIIKIHQSTFSDFERYAWENNYRRGTLFHALYSNDIGLLNQLITTLFEEDSIAALNKANTMLQNNSKSNTYDKNDLNSPKEAPAAKPFRKQSRDIQTKLESQMFVSSFFFFCLFFLFYLICDLILFVILCWLFCYLILFVSCSCFKLFLFYYRVSRVWSVLLIFIRV